MSATEERLRRAEEYLAEAVYRSRGAQAGASVLAGPSKCGLGDEPAVVLDLSPKGEELYRALWPSELVPEALEAVRAVTADWIRRQDALDRKRNHFLKAFRGEHGADRSHYDEEQAAAYRAGLDAVNAEVDAGRRAAAEALLSAGG